MLVLALSLPPGPATAETPTTLLHAFSFADGMAPHGSLIAVGDYLYGMTLYGGTDSGVIYRLSKTGDDSSVIHDFTNGSGIYPYGSLVEVNGRLYGMTERTTYSVANGVLFSIELDGSNYFPLHTFLGATGGDGT